MPAAGFEPAVPAGKRPQTYALSQAASGIGVQVAQWRPFLLFVMDLNL